jgi:hypothetical protein
MTKPKYKTAAELHPETATGFFAMFSHIFSFFSHIFSGLSKNAKAFDQISDIPLNSVPRLSEANDRWLQKLVADSAKSDLQQAIEAKKVRDAANNASTTTTPDPA